MRRAFPLKFLLCTEYMFALSGFVKGINLNHIGVMGKDVDDRKEINFFYSVPHYSVVRYQGCDLQQSWFGWLGLCWVSYCSRDSRAGNLLSQSPGVILSSTFIFHIQGFKAGNTNWLP